MRNLNIKIFCKSKNGIKNLFHHYALGLAANKIAAVTDERGKTINYIQNNINVWVSFQRTPEHWDKNSWYTIECMGPVIDEVYYEIQKTIAENDTDELYFVVKLKGIL